MPPAPAPAAAGTPLTFVTGPGWAPSQVPHIAELLVEQAHLEKKAASAAVTLLFRVGGPIEAQRTLSALAREELAHFERTLRLCAQRGIAFATLPPSGYAEALKMAIRRSMPERLADELLVAAIIEARSCERMGLLAAALLGRDDEVAEFYADLVLAEARHEQVYLEIAARLLPAGELAQRWQALVAHEAAVCASLPWAPRLHGGMPAGAELGR